MSTIRAVLLANTKHWGKAGDEIDASPQDIQRYPHILRAKSDIAAEQAQQQVNAPSSAQDWHQAQRAKLREERARVEEQQALMAQERAKLEQERADAAAERARKVAEESALAAKVEALEAENRRLKALQAQKETADAALAELAQVPVVSPAPQPEKPKDEPAAPRPHERKRPQ